MKCPIPANIIFFICTPPPPLFPRILPIWNICQTFAVVSTRIMGANGDQPSDPMAVPCLNPFRGSFRGEESFSRCECNWSLVGIFARRSNRATRRLPTPPFPCREAEDLALLGRPPPQCELSVAFGERWTLSFERSLEGSYQGSLSQNGVEWLLDLLEPSKL